MLSLFRHWRPRLSLLMVLSVALICPITLAQGDTSDSDDLPNNCKNIEDQNNIRPPSRFDEKLLSLYSDKTIGEIDIRVDKIFDETNPQENNRLYRFANRVQVLTKKNVIRNQLLFSPGDKINPDDIEESLRILFRRAYILESGLVITRVCDDTIDVRVVVRNAWVIEPRLSFGREGGENSAAIGLKDGNFLGSGSEVALLYKKNPDRSQVIYRFSTHHFLGRRLDADFYHADLSDGTNSRIAIAKPFYSVNTRWSYGFETGETSLRFKTRFRDDITNEFRQITELDSLFIGKAIGIDRTHSHRLSVGYTQQDIVFENVDATNLLPEDELQRYPWVELSRVTNRFGKYNNLSFIERAEDVPLGIEYRIRVGRGENAADETIDRVIADLSRAMRVRDDHLFKVGLLADVVHNSDRNDQDDSIYGVRATFNHFVNGSNRWHTHFEFDVGENLSEFRQVVVGETNGLRGYPLSFQRGDKRYIVNIERRFYSKTHLFNLVRAGAVLFIDFGRAWGSDSFQNTPHLQSVGAGLRLHSSKTGTPAVVHLNLGVPLNKNETQEKFLISLSVRGTF